MESKRSHLRELRDRFHQTLRRSRFAYLSERHNPVVVLSLFSFINGCLSIAIMSGIAWMTSESFIFPSLGPTAFLFFSTPLAHASSPRNALGGHFIGVLAGMASLYLFGLQDAPAVIISGVSGERIGAAALSIGLTSGLMILLRVHHPPAGATTLIIALGFLRTPREMLILMIAVVLLIVQSFIINRLAGVPYPLWSTPPET